MKWKQKKLGELIDLYDHIRIPLSGIERENRKGEYPYYGAQSIIDYVNEYLFDGDYILIAEDGENLRTRTQPIAFSVSGQFWVNNHAHIVKGKSNISDDLFIKFFLNNTDINPYVTGAAQPKLSQRNLKEIEINTPPLPTQRKIASILSAYDDLIENNLKRIKLLEEAALMSYKLLYQNSAKLKEYDLAEVWEIKYGKNLPQTKITEKGKFPVYGASGVMGFYEEANCLFPVPLVTSRGNGSGVVHRTNQPAFVTNNSFTFIPKEGFEEIHFHFAEMILRDLNLQQLRSGTAQPQLTIAGLIGVKVKLPTMNQLEDFNKLVDTQFSLIFNLEKQITKLREARDILLPQLMSGEIEV